LSSEDWFEDATDARKYVGEVGRLWTAWLVGLGALALSRGGASLAVGAALLVAMFVLMNPLQQRVQARFAEDPSARKLAPRKTLSSRDKALRQLTYGPAVFSEAVATGGLWRVLKLVPWLVIVATLVAAAFVASAWFDS
jgi:hypothetical protein